MPVDIEGKNYYWIFEICLKAGVSRSTILRWLKSGVIPEPIKDRRGWRIFNEDELGMIIREVKKTR